MKKYCFILFAVFNLFHATSKAQFKKLSDFNFSNGYGPGGALVLNRGTLYGMAIQGGKDSDGVIFSIDTNGNGYKILHSFNGTDGAESAYCSLTLAGNKFYGVTSNGGAKNYGVIFSMDTNGNGYKVLFSFDSLHGKTPNGQVFVSGAKLLGATQYGGANNNGVLYCIDTNGSNYKVLYYFNSTNGGQPMASLSFFGNTFYGTTQTGGKYTEGTIFSIDTNGGSFTTIYNFMDTGSMNAGAASGQLVISNNTLFGVTAQGGPGVDGVLYSIHTNGSGFKFLHDFSYGSNGESPSCSLVLSNNILYGVSQSGNNACTGCGNIFSIDTNGNNYTCMYSFSGTDGSRPVACGLTLWGGEIYGVTHNGGLYNDGVIFSYKDSNVTTSVNQLPVGSSQLLVYPNPVNGLLTVEVNSEKLKMNNTIDVYNTLGERVYTQNIKSMQGENTFTLDVSNYSKGVYLLQVITADGTNSMQKKFVVE